MIVGEGIVANSGGGSGVNQPDIYVYGAKASTTGINPLIPLVNNMFTLNGNRLFALKAGNYKIEACMSASSVWNRVQEGQTYHWEVTYIRTTLQLYINGTRDTSWSPFSNPPTNGNPNPYGGWSSSITLTLNANDIVNFYLASSPAFTQCGGVIIRITEV